MSVSIFLSHTEADKQFVRKLALDFDSHGIWCWLDEAELKVGDSLIERIREAIDRVDYVAVILSPRSVVAPWVQREVDVAMNQEISGRRIKVLPIMYETCELPGFLLGKFYSDFTDEAEYPQSFKRLVESVGIVFNKLALEPCYIGQTLGQATDRAVGMNLPILGKPLHRPFQYIGLELRDAARVIGQTPNSAGNILIETEECCMFLESEGNFISYVEVDFKKTFPHFLSREFDSEPLLGSLSINPAELDLVRKKTHCHTYYDHRKKLKINVSCKYDEGPLSVGFSSKYYGM